MADYWVDDGGDGTAGTSWATAYASIAALISAVPAALTTAGNRIFIGDDHVDSVTGANRSFTGPSADPGVLLISCDRTDAAAVPAYKVGTGKSLRSDDGAHTLTLDGSFALFGLRIVSGGTGTGAITLAAGTTKGIYAEGCAFVLAANGGVTYGVSGGVNSVILRDCSVDLTLDLTTTRTNAVFTAADAGRAALTATGLSFTNAGYRTGVVFVGGRLNVSGSDFSGFNNGTACELVSNAAIGTFLNCKTISSPAPAAGHTAGSGYDQLFVNCGPSDAPEALWHYQYNGRTAYSASVYRSSGATVEGAAVSWQYVTPASVCTETLPYRGPWMYGVVASTGSKTFDVYIANNTADLTDAEVWLEVESMGDAGGSSQYESTLDRRTITSTAANQTDDTGSTWNGTTLAYMQKLSVTATVDRAGLFRARVVLGKASVTDLYVDPKVTVS